MQQRWKVFTVAILGTVVEYYDYALYGFTAAIIAVKFFPQQDPTVALIQSFGVFAAGSFAKPIGALIFGHVGDRQGRSPALKNSMLGITFPTLLIGLMPTYQEWGWLSACLLLLCRICQGIFIAGESDGVRILLFEFVSRRRACLANSLMGVGATTGIYLASLGAALAIRSGEAEWLWRLPFLMGSLFGVFIWWLRQYIDETPEYRTYQQTSAFHQPLVLRSLLWKNRWLTVATILLCGAVGGTYHFYLVFWQTYLHTVLHLATAAEAMMNASLAILIYTFMAPLAGLVADYKGINAVLKWSSMLLLICIMANGVMIHQGVMPFWLILLTAAVLAFFSGPGFVLLLHAAKVEERYRCISLGHSIGSMLLSGSTPAIAMVLWKSTNFRMAPLIYFAGLVMAGQIGIKIASTLAYKANPIHAHPDKAAILPFLKDMKSTTCPFPSHRVYKKI